MDQGRRCADASFIEPPVGEAALGNDTQFAVHGIECTRRAEPRPQREHVASVVASLLHHFHHSASESAPMSRDRSNRPCKVGFDSRSSTVPKGDRVCGPVRQLRPPPASS